MPKKCTRTNAVELTAGRCCSDGAQRGRARDTKDAPFAPTIVMRPGGGAFQRQDTRHKCIGICFFPETPCFGDLHRGCHTKTKCQVPGKRFELIFRSGYTANWGTNPPVYRFMCFVESDGHVGTFRQRGFQYTGELSHLFLTPYLAYCEMRCPAVPGCTAQM